MPFSRTFRPPPDERPPWPARRESGRRQGDLSWRTAATVAAGYGARSPGTAPRTWISMSSTVTTCACLILQVFRNSIAPSTETAPLATSALPAPPLSHRPVSFNSWLSSTWSRSSWNSIRCMSVGAGSELRIFAAAAAPSSSADGAAGPGLRHLRTGQSRQARPVRG